MYVDDTDLSFFPFNHRQAKTEAIFFTHPVINQNTKHVNHNVLYVLDIWYEAGREWVNLKWSELWHTTATRKAYRAIPFTSSSYSITIQMRTLSSWTLVVPATHPPDWTMAVLNPYGSKRETEERDKMKRGISSDRTREIKRNLRWDRETMWD